ncbi:hypothetical protein [Aeromonas salmonicida]|uniref:hypothetical protein n=1 Tax=Aeromonas salmonicida TaxID=645 RepID=UPI0007301A04|nr:hypothetical protein [Aeromonas salmonicida]KTA75090.1 hypothetical protein VO68_18305 [Aeromonas salmonicida]RSM22194.1 hypothetical protein C5B76_19185 [Aeromonas salmonicida]
MDLLLLFGLLAMGATLYAMRCWDRRHAHPDWQRLPTRAEYLSTHPECTTDDVLGARCCACGSDKVLGYPQTGWYDNRFRHTCLACSKVLYRTEEPR